MGEKSGDDWEDEEDWTDTTWAEPQTHDHARSSVPQVASMVDAALASNRMSKHGDPASDDVKTQQGKFPKLQTGCFG
jgi:hypothetical protein